jgi:hypothetical protein
VLEATYGWYWAVGVLRAGAFGAAVGVKGFTHRCGGHDGRIASFQYVIAVTCRTGLGDSSRVMAGYSFIRPSGCYIGGSSRVPHDHSGTAHLVRPAASVVYASVFAAVLASIRALRTSLVVFDTAVVASVGDNRDRPERWVQAGDPVDDHRGHQTGADRDRRDQRWPAPPYATA